MEGFLTSATGRRLWTLLVALMLGALALSACGGAGSVGCGDINPGRAGDSEANYFSNPSFEEGSEPWCSLETSAWGKPFSVSQRQAQSGANSALLELRSTEEGAGSAFVYGVVQELELEEFPDVLSGYYYVDRWEKGTPRQYLQFVVIVFGVPNLSPEPNHQIRYILAGVDSQPTFISNARYVMLSRDEPKVGEWVYFERNIREDFQELWGGVPEDFGTTRILFEVRWDDRTPADGLSAADVFYDNLYLGPAGQD